MGSRRGFCFDLRRVEDTSTIGVHVFVVVCAWVMSGCCDVCMVRHGAGGIQKQKKKKNMIKTPGPESDLHNFHTSVCGCVGVWVCACM